MASSATFYDANAKPIAYSHDADFPSERLRKVYRARSQAQFNSGVKALVASGELAHPSRNDVPYQGGAIYYHDGEVQIYYNGRLQGAAAAFAANTEESLGKILPGVKRGARSVKKQELGVDSGNLTGYAITGVAMFLLGVVFVKTRPSA